VLNVDPDYVDAALNEWDSFATEEALQLKERLGGEVVVVTCGERGAEAALRRCLAMGADRAIRVEGAGRDPFAVARALADVVRGESPDLVLCGVQSSDSGQAATGTVLAELLELPRLAVVVKLDVDGGGGRAVVNRELEGGLHRHARARGGRAAHAAGTRYARAAIDRALPEPPPPSIHCALLTPP